MDLPLLRPQLGARNVKTCIIGTYRAPEGWATNENQLAALRGSNLEKNELLEPSKIWFTDLEILIKNLINYKAFRPWGKSVKTS